MIPHNSPPYRRVHALAALLTLVASAFVALAVPGPAMASVCGDKVLADWFDNGRIDRLYQAHCYEEAIDAIPDDLRDYANARGDHLARAPGVAPERARSRRPRPDPRRRSPEAAPGTSGGSDPNDPTADPGSQATPDVDTTGISSVPIPLLVLGGMSIMLLAAGGLGYLSRRRAAAHDDGAHGSDDDLPI